MAEKKTGPVKPPTIDMQARRPSPRTPSKAAEVTASEDKNIKAAPSQGAAAETSKPDVGKAADRKSDIRPDIRAADKNTPRPANTASARAGTGSSSPHASSSARGDRAASATADKRPAALSFAAIALAVVGGAMLSVIVVLALAYTGLLGRLMPETDGQTIEDLSNRVTLAQEQVSESLVGFNAINRRLGELSASVDVMQTDLAGEFDALSARQTEQATTIDALQSTPVVSVDLTPVNRQIEQISARIDALAAGASAEDAGQFATDLTDLQQNLATLSAQTAGFDERLSTLSVELENLSRAGTTAEDTLASVQESLAALRDAPQATPVDTTLLRLPFALSGLQSALDNGQPFAAELKSLTDLVPEITPSSALVAAAEPGLPAPGRITAAYSRTVPEIMAARPVDPNASWSDAAWERVKSLLAIRPTGETDGGSVDSLLAATENHLANRNFAAAADALHALPESMQQAAGNALLDIELMAEAQNLLHTARTLALSDSAEVTE